MVNKLIKQLNKDIVLGLKSGFIKEGYFTSWKYNTQSEAHSRLLGLISGACHEPWL
jgi:hypothetical protein